MTEQRSGIAKVLRDSPGLRPTVAATIAAGLPAARRLAALALEEYGETPRRPLDQLFSYSETEVLGLDFWPEVPGSQP